MADTVVDASVVAAVIFEEPHPAPLVHAVSRSFLAPSLIRYELANLCATKLRRDSASTRLILARYEIFLRLEFRTEEPDWELLPELARRWGLSAYDAAYLQLAQRHRLPLVTLDARLAKAHAAATRG